MAVIVAVPAGRVGAGTADAEPKATTGVGAPATGDACVAEMPAGDVAVRVGMTGDPATASRRADSAGRGRDATVGTTITVDMTVAAKMLRRSVCTRSCYHADW